MYFQILWRWLTWFLQSWNVRDLHSRKIFERYHCGRSVLPENFRNPHPGLFLKVSPKSEDSRSAISMNCKHFQLPKILDQTLLIVYVKAVIRQIQWTVNGFGFSKVPRLNLTKSMCKNRNKANFTSTFQVLLLQSLQIVQLLLFKYTVDSQYKRLWYKQSRITSKGFHIFLFELCWYHILPIEATIGYKWPFGCPQTVAYSASLLYYNCKKWICTPGYRRSSNFLLNYASQTLVFMNKYCCFTRTLLKAWPIREQNCTCLHFCPHWCNQFPDKEWFGTPCKCQCSPAQGRFCPK